MRKFECQDCHNVFEVSHGTGVRGRDMKCPQCGSTNIYRSDYPADDVNNPGWGSRWMGFIGRGRADYRGRGMRGRGWRRNSDQGQMTEQQDDQETK